MTKAKEALDDFPSSYNYKIVSDLWFVEHRKTIRRALELLDKVERGGDKLDLNDYLDRDLSGYILIKREEVG